MSRIDQLIEELCPEGVEWKTLEEVCMKTNNIKWKESQNIDYHYIDLTAVSRDNNEISNTQIINSSNAPSRAQQIVLKGDIIYGTTRPTLKRIAIIPENYHRQICSTGFCVIRANREAVLSKYLFFQLNTATFLSYVESNQEGASYPSISDKKLKQFQIPFPPLPIQQEIVSILDTFTALDASLQAELEARRKQYEHYRDQLLSFEGKEVEWKTLGEIGELVRGTGLQKSDFVESGIGCVHYGQIYTYYGSFVFKTKSFVSEDLAIKLKKVNSGDLIITTTSENVDDVCKAIAWLGDNEIVTGAHATIFKHNQNAKYLTYYFQTDDFSNQKKRFAKGTKVIEIKANEIAKFKIPIPPLAEQHRIVSILDKFDTLVNTELPAEIAARRKQYAYYREKLLTFKPLKS